MICFAHSLKNECGCPAPFPCSSSTTVTSTATFTCNSTYLGLGMCTSSTATQSLNHQVHMMDDPFTCIGLCDASAECYAASIGFSAGSKYCIEYSTDEVDGTDGDPSLQCYKKCTDPASGAANGSTTTSSTNTSTSSTTYGYGPPLNPTMMCRGSSAHPSCVYDRQG